MNIFFKAAAFILVALILYLILSKWGKDYSILLTIAVCCVIAVYAMEFLDEIITFITQLQVLSEIDQSFISILLKSVGIGMLTEIIGLICVDAGNVAFNKMLHLLATLVIIWISLPLFEILISQIEEILLAL